MLTRGSVSTLPFAWRTPWDDGHHRAALDNLGRLSDALEGIEASTGRAVRVGLEPEPGCVVETTAEAVERLAGVDTDRIGVSLDLCHLAVGFEDPEEALSRIAAGGFPVTKAQVSAAVHADDPADPATRRALAEFDEVRFLHQVRGRHPDGVVVARDDLPDALSGDDPLADRAADGSAVPWRVHFHVPLDAEPEPPLTSTRDHTRSSLTALVGGASAVTDHLEVETYTWGVLPEHARPRTDDDLARRIAAEVGWVRDQLVHLGLKETHVSTTDHLPAAPAPGAAPLPVLLLDVVGLTPRALKDMPRLRALAEKGSQAALATILPAVTCSVQSTFLTGSMPAEHGVVGNGWFFRDLGEVMFWRQPTAWCPGRRCGTCCAGPTRTPRSPTSAGGTRWAWTWTPSSRPAPSTTRTAARARTATPGPTWLRDELTEALGEFPLFQYWGPTATIASSRWIVEATRRVLPHHDLTMVYVPHLDYDLQRFGPRSPGRAPRHPSSTPCGHRCWTTRRRGGRGRRSASTASPRSTTRAPQSGAARGGAPRGARRAGRRGTSTPGASAAFAVADHQVAHVYVRRGARGRGARLLAARRPGSSRCSTGQSRRTSGWTTRGPATWSRSPSRTPGSPTTTGSTTRRAPDFARTVDIHRKPGYDPGELFLDPADRRQGARGAGAGAEEAGHALLMDVIPLDAAGARQPRTAAGRPRRRAGADHLHTGSPA